MTEIRSAEQAIEVAEAAYPAPTDRYWVADEDVAGCWRLWQQDNGIDVYGVGLYVGPDGTVFAFSSEAIIHGTTEIRAALALRYESGQDLPAANIRRWVEAVVDKHEHDARLIAAGDGDDGPDLSDVTSHTD